MPITSAEYQRLVARAAAADTLEAQRDRDRQDAEAVRLREVAAREGAESALNQQREAWARDLETERRRARDVETRWHNAERERTIAGQLSGIPFVSPEAAGQVRQLLEGRFETRADATGAIVVQEVGTGRPAADVIRESLATPAFAHFIRPSTGGGAGSPTPVPGQQQSEMNPIESHLFGAYRGQVQPAQPVVGFGPRSIRNN